MFFGSPSVFLDPVFHIFSVDFNEAAKGHIQLCFQFVCVFTLPGKGFTFGCESPFLGLSAFSCVIGVSEDHSPGVCGFIFINRHFDSPFLVLFGSITGAFHEVLSIDPTGNGQKTELVKLCVELADDFIGIRFGNSHDMRYFIHTKVVLL